jgi:hypothetical protein
MRATRTGIHPCGSGLVQDRNQRRNVQRRDCKGGGDGSGRDSVLLARSQTIASADTIATVPNSC